MGKFQKPFTDNDRLSQNTRYMGLFLAISYGVGGPVTAFLQYRDQLFSTRFDWPPALIFATTIVQFFCALGILIKSTRRLSAFCLTIISIGAIVSHIKIGSPATAIPAFLYSALQVWYILRLKSQ